MARSFATNMRTSAAQSCTSSVRVNSRQVWFRQLLKLALILPALLIASCDNTGQKSSTSAPDAIRPGGLTIGLPGPIASVRMITVDQLRAEASIGGNAIAVTSRSGAGGELIWQSEPFALPGPGTHALEIRWFDTSNEEDLLLADFGPLMIDETSSRTISVTEADYSYQHDEDEDGQTNISEVRNGSDPFDATSPGPSADDSGTNVNVSAPGTIRSAPFVISEQLDAEIVLFNSDDEVSFTMPLSRDGENWTGRLEPRNADETFTIFWRERVGSRRLVLGFNRLLDDSIGIAGRAIQDEDLRFIRTSLDEDDDGRTNLRERETGTDPGVADDPSPYNDAQTACATADFVTLATMDTSILPNEFIPPLIVSPGLSTEIPVEITSDSRFLKGLLAVTGPGALRVQHQAGPPNDSVIELWERELDGTLTLQARNDEPGDDPNTRTRATLETELTSGGYCLLMFQFHTGTTLLELGASDDGVPTTNLLIEYQ